jgi:hypothetical protein
MDREIEFADAAGLDYWAFLTYHPDSPMTIALNRYLASKKRSGVRFCVIAHHIRVETPEAEIERLVGYMKDPRHVTVLDGRPLVYAFHCAAGKGFFEGLLKAAADAGLKRPYLVNMGNNAQNIPFDASSSYTGKGAGQWSNAAAQGRKVIPAVSAGWDPRPRQETPVPWGGHYGKFDGRRGPLRTPEQAAAAIARGVKDAIDWNRANPVAGEAKAVVIYAWNEFDEGGWICPTLSEGAGRLNAIARVLEEAGSKEGTIP